MWLFWASLSVTRHSALSSFQTSIKKPKLFCYNLKKLAQWICMWPLLFFASVLDSASWPTLPVVHHLPSYVSSLGLWSWHPQLLLTMHCSRHIQSGLAAVSAWLSRGGLGMRSLSRHSPAAYIASLSSGFGASSQHHLTQLAVDSLVTSSEAVCMEDVLASTILQKVVSNKVATISSTSLLRTLCLQTELTCSLSLPITLLHAEFDVT